MFRFTCLACLVLSLFCGCLKQEFGGLGIQVPAGKTKITDKNPFVIVSVFEGSTGEKAGLQQGDIITAVDGQSIDGMEYDKVVNELLRGKVGSMVTIEVIREDKIIVFSIPRGRIVLDE